MENAVQPNVVQTPTDATRKRFSWKNVLIGVVAGVIVIAAGIGCWYWYISNQPEATSEFSTSTKTSTSSAKTATLSSKTDETAGWKTFTSNDNVYSFNYPTDWELNDNTASAGFVYVLCMKNTNCNTSGNSINLFQVSVLIYKTVDEYWNNITEDKNGVYDKRKTTFLGFEAVEAIQTGGPQAGGSSIIYFVPYKGKGYQLFYRYPSLLDATKLEEFSNPRPNIISTFFFRMIVFFGFFFSKLF
jgi:hypothetical protein